MGRPATNNERMAKMRGYRERIGGSLRASLLLGVSTVAMLMGLTGCGWFESSGPVSTTQVRPGAERSVAVSASLPSGGSGRQYDAGITAVDETRGPQIGSIVAGKGGQQAQKDELAKTELENDRKARAESERQLAERKAAEAAEAAGKPSVPATPVSPPATPEAAVPPPAPVTTTDVPPPAPATDAPPPAPATDVPPPAPATDATPPSAVSPPAPTPAPVAVPPRADAAPSPAPVTVAAAPASPANPNRAFEPPPGWVPPGQTAPVQSAAVQKESFQTVAATEPAAVASPSVPTPAAPPPPAVAPLAAAPASPANPNKAFVPPPGWAPPGQTTAVQTAPVQTAPVQTAALSAPAAVPPAPEVAGVAPPPTRGVTTEAILAPPGGALQVAVIQFNRASADLGGDDGDILRKIAEIQRQNGGTVRVVAHAAQDASGLSADQTERGNYEVSRRRALAVANHLMALGVPRSAIIAEAASDSQPRYATNSPRGIAANRRAEIFLDL
jgi:flagellar motor protein MotB